MNCDRLETQSSSRLLNQFLEILGILSNTVAEAATSFDSEGVQIRKDHYLILPVTEIPKWLKFNHHQSVGNSVSFLVGHKFSNLVVCVALTSMGVKTDAMGVKTDAFYGCGIYAFINGEEQFINTMMWWPDSNCDNVWLIYGKVNISNPFEENRIVVEVRGPRFSPNSMRIYPIVECICCPQKSNISMDQCAFNNGEEDSGRVGIRRRLRRRNHRPTHARRFIFNPQYLFNDDTKANPSPPSQSNFEEKMMPCCY
nr:hypothetical protein CFP56_43394 [Quercus suber]